MPAVGAKAIPWPEVPPSAGDPAPLRAPSVSSTARNRSREMPGALPRSSAQMFGLLRPVPPPLCVACAAALCSSIDDLAGDRERLAPLETCQQPLIGPALLCCAWVLLPSYDRHVRLLGFGLRWRRALRVGRTKYAVIGHTAPPSSWRCHRQTIPTNRPSDVEPMLRK